MTSTLFSRRWRRVTLFVLCIAVAGSAALALMIESDREKAIAAAKLHGEATIVRGDLRSVKLRNRKAVDEVLPLLKHVPELRALDIALVDLTAADMEEIGKHNSLVNLTLQRCALTSDHLKALQNLTTVSRLNLSLNPITDPGLRALGKMTGLETIDLSFTRIQGEGLQYLTGLPALQELWLTGTEITDDSVERCTQLSHVRRLYIPQTNVTAHGLIRLAKMYWLDTLAFPDSIPQIARRQFSEQFIEARRAARAEGKVVPSNDRPPF